MKANYCPPSKLWSIPQRLATVINLVTLFQVTFHIISHLFVITLGVIDVFTYVVSKTLKCPPLKICCLFPSTMNMMSYHTLIMLCGKRHLANIIKTPNELT